MSKALVIAILLGITVRSAWRPGGRFQGGIALGAKQVLAVAVTLLGASLSLGAIVASGPALLTGIVGTVVLTIAASYAICGNSAIAAVAPVIGAPAQDVAASIAVTAVLGVLMVLGLPLFVPLAGLSENQYGVLAGLTV